jgi:hypothetical protein
MGLQVALIGGENKNKSLLKTLLDELKLNNIDVKDFIKLLDDRKKDELLFPELKIDNLVINKSMKIYPDLNCDLFDRNLLRTFNLEKKLNEYNGHTCNFDISKVSIKIR